MELSRSQLPLLLNALYELGHETISVKHPSTEIGELFQIDLRDPTESVVSVTTGAVSYDAALEAIQHSYGEHVRKELPNSAAYVKAIVASGLADIRNLEEVNEFVKRYGYADLREGHPPRYAAFDTNLLPWRMHDVLEIDPQLYSDDAGRDPVNGYTIPSGVESELKISYRYGKNAMPASELADAFGSEYERLAGQPTEDNRETRLGLRELRHLSETRPNDVIPSETGDAEIIQGCIDYYANEPTGVILFSNDFGFVDQARDQKIPAVHIDFDIDVADTLTGTWDQISTLLYELSVTFGVIVLPKATLYGAWNDKDQRNWKNEEIDVDPRSSKLKAILNRDKPIVESHSKFS